MDATGTFIVGAIIGAEIGFWVLLFFGLAARYVLRWQRVSTALLVSVPVIDVVLIALVAFDLSRGTDPTAVHAIAAVYLGFSIGFGRRVITSVDEWFAFRFAGGPKPLRVPKTGPERVNHEWCEWLRVVVAWAIAVIALLAMKAFSGWSIPDSLEGLWTDELWAWIGRLTIVNVVWFVTGPTYSFLFQAERDPTARVTPEQERV